jgi:streptogramin lyase
LDPARLDADRFEKLVEQARYEEPQDRAETLREALRLWRGPPLADMAYESFTQSEISRLEELRLTAVEDRIDADLALGRERELIPELKALVRDHQLRERLRVQLMLALYRAGRQTEALECFSEGRRRLVDELGIEPGPELQELQQQILAQDPALGAVRRPTTLALVARQRWKLIAAGAVLVAIALTAAAVGLTRRGTGDVAVAAVPNTVAAIDPQTNRLVAAYSVGIVPRQLATGGNAVWVVNGLDGTLSRIEPRTRSVRTFATGGPVDTAHPPGYFPALAVGPDGAWVANRDTGTVSRLDPRSGEVVRTVRLRSGGFKTLALSIAASSSDVWVFGGTCKRCSWRTWRPTAWRIDPRTSKVTLSVALDDMAAAAVIAGDSLWIRGRRGILRLDRRTGRFKGRLPLPLGPCCPSALLAAGADSVWAAGHVWRGEVVRGVLWRIDSRTGLKVATVPLAAEAWGGIAVGGRAVWVADSSGTITRVNANTNRVVARIRIDGSPTALAFAYGRLWIALD